MSQKQKFIEVIHHYSLILISVFGILLSLYGCATVPYITPGPPVTVPGIYHKVEKGQTLWKISKIYGVDLDEIVRINRISDVANIEIGQLIFIPHYQKPEYSNKKYSATGEDFIWPVKGKVITLFGQTSHNMIKKGINIHPYKANDDIVAARSGRVTFVTDDFKGFGKTIIIDHGDGIFTVYARNSQIFVKPGDYVQRGNLIARVGATGRDKSVYLHFQIRRGHTPQNPYFYLNP